MKCISTRNPTLDEGFRVLQDQSAMRSPPHPMKPSQGFILSRAGARGTEVE